MRGRAPCLSFLSAFAAVVSATVTVRAAPPPGTSWSLDASRSDEFNGTALDASKWSYTLWYDGKGYNAFKSSDVSVSGGALLLKFQKESYAGYPYTGGAVISTFSVPGEPSYVEISAQVMDYRTDVTSEIWLMDPNGSDNPSTEIDIQESLLKPGGGYLSSTVQYWQTNGGHTSDGTHDYYTGALDDAFHIYGVERNNGRIRFWIDGKLAWDMKPSQAMASTEDRKVILNLESWNGVPVDAYLPANFRIDYVRTYTGGASVPDAGSAGAGGGAGIGGSAAGGESATSGGADGSLSAGGWAGGSIDAGSGGTSSSAGGSAGTSSTTDGSAATNGSSASANAGSCGCSAPGRRPIGDGALALVSWLGLVVLRRRRRRGRARAEVQS
jgi:Glycosyl hydrolases family 16